MSVDEAWIVGKNMFVSPERVCADQNRMMLLRQGERKL